jgi:hypothetical protein
MEGPIIGENQPEQSDGEQQTTWLPSFSSSSVQEPQPSSDDRKGGFGTSKNHVINPGMKGLQTSEMQTLF